MRQGIDTLEVEPMAAPQDQGLALLAAMEDPAMAPEMGDPSMGPDGGIQSLGTMEEEAMVPEGGIQGLSGAAEMLAQAGREGDIYIVHASEGDTVVPQEVLEGPGGAQIREMLFRQMAEIGVDPERYVVGHELNSLNPETGLPEFFFKKAFSSIKSFFKKAAPIVLPMLLSMTPLGPILGAAAGSGIASYLGGGSAKDALKAAAIGGVTAGFLSGVSGAMGAQAQGLTTSQGFMEGVQSGLPEGFAGSAFSIDGSESPLNPGTGPGGSPGERTIPETIYDKAFPDNAAGSLAGDGIKTPRTDISMEALDPRADLARKTAVLEQAKNARLNAKYGEPTLPKFFEEKVSFPHPNQRFMVDGPPRMVDGPPKSLGEYLVERQKVDGPPRMERMDRISGSPARMPSPSDRLPPAPPAPTPVVQAKPVQMVERISGGPPRMPSPFQGLPPAPPAATPVDMGVINKATGNLAGDYFPSGIGGTPSTARGLAISQELTPQLKAIEAQVLSGDMNPDVARTLKAQIIRNASVNYQQYLGPLGVAGVLAYAGGAFDEPEQDPPPNSFATNPINPNLVRQYRLFQNDKITRPVANPPIQFSAHGGEMQNFPPRIGAISGPGTGKSDDVPAMLSDGEFVLTEQAVRGAGGGNHKLGVQNLYELMRNFEATV